MAAFVSGNIPSNIDTVEKLGLWVGMLLHKMNKPLVKIEQRNGQQIPVTDFYLFTDPDGETRAIVRLNFKMSDSYLSDNSQKFWQFVEDFSQTTIPTDFTTD